MQKIILATESKYKKALFSRLNLHFVSMAAKIDETPLTGESANSLAIRLAKQKATHIFEQTEGDAYVLGADQTANCNGKLVSKPMTHKQACKDLRTYSGNRLYFHTSVCCMAPDGSITEISEITEVLFRQLPDEDISAYLAKEQPYDCAGAFKAEALGISLFDSITSSDPTALIGLPLIELARYFRQEGFDLYR